MSPHLALVPARPLGPRRVGLLGELRVGTGALRGFDEHCVVDPRAGTSAVGAVHEHCDGLGVDLDAHGSVQADGALVVTVTLQVRHLDGADGAPGARGRDDGGLGGRLDALRSRLSGRARLPGRGERHDHQHAVGLDRGLLSAGTTKGPGP